MIRLYCKDINLAFERSILWLIENRDTRTVGSVSQWFKIEFNGYAMHDEWFDWEYVVFPNEEDATMFMLRFS